jgi:UDP-2-acetamido-3-amino-2,3-dideoxy-glucuronate N-acetyltransferase
MQNAAQIADELLSIDPTARIHPLAHVENAHIGARTRVWQFASVIRGTVLGADCNVASCATLDGPVFGDRCIISQGVAMGPGFLFGSDIFVGPNVTICNDRWPTTSKQGFDLTALQRGRWAVIVMDGASIGANAVVLPGVTIGARAMIAAGAVVERNVPADYLLRRDGQVVPIKPEWRKRRMRQAEC